MLWRLPLLLLFTITIFLKKYLQIFVFDLFNSVYIKKTIMHFFGVFCCFCHPLPLFNLLVLFFSLIFLKNLHVQLSSLTFQTK